MIAKGLNETKNYSFQKATFLDFLHLEKMWTFETSILTVETKKSCPG